jgi:uncharacterized membrane protein YqjE
VDPGSGLLDSLRGMAQTLVGAVHTRVQLLGNELEEQGTRIAQMALLWAVAGFCLALAVVLGAALLVVLLWDSHRVVVLAVLTALFAIAGTAALLIARALAKARPAPFASTLAELEADQAALAVKGRQPS